MPFALGALIVALPTYLYAALVRNIDRYEKEPVRYLLAAFLWGAIPAVLLGMILEVVLALPVAAILGKETVATTFITTGVMAPIVEEILKGLALAAIYLWRRREFDGWIDGIVYGSTVGFGFAYVENLLYLSGGTTDLQSWFSLFFLRVVVLGFMHGFWTSLTGIGFGIARYRSSDLAKAAAIALGLSAAILGHMLHNGSLALSESTSGATLCVSGVSYLTLIGLMLGLSAVAGRRERDVMKTYLADEVPGLIRPDAYAALCDTAVNARGVLGMLPKEQQAFTKLACKLALRKRGLTADHMDHAHPVAQSELAALRAQLRIFNPVAPDPAPALPL